jgi:hypothetical protein
VSRSPSNLKALDVPVFVAHGVRHLAETNLECYSCLPFWKGVFSGAIPSRAKPSVVSAASITEPLSLIRARGKARFCKA